MSMNRREFLGSAAFMATAAATSSTAARAEGKKYKACIIGDGKEGRYGHSMHLAFASRGDVEVVGLADPDEESRAAHAAEAGAQRAYAEYREMLEKERPDLVAVGPRSTPNHEAYVLACAEVGAHGFIEKPLCASLDEAGRMAAAIEAKDLKWAIGFNMRVTPTIEHVRKLVCGEGLIGRVLELRGRGKEDARAGGEDLIVLGTHVFDLMIHLFGMPAWCEAEILSDGKPAVPGDVREATESLGPIVGDCVNARYGFPNAIAGYFASVKTPDGNGGRFGLDLYGTRGIVSTRCSAVPKAVWLENASWNDGGWKPLPGAPDFAIRDQARERHKLIADDLIAAIEEDRQPAASLKDGRNALEMIQAVNESHAAGRRVEIPLKERSHPLKRWS